MKTCLSPVLLVVLALGFATEARAQLVVSDSFSGYTAGSMSGQGTGLGTGWTTSSWYNVSGSATAVPTSGLTYSGVTSQNGLVQIGSPGAAQRSFSAVSSGTLYVGALVQFPDANSGFRLIGFGGNNTSGNNGNVMMGQIHQNAGTTDIWLELRRGSDGNVTAGPSEDTGLVPVANQTTYLVARIDFNTSGSLDSVYMWVNPTSATQLQNAATASVSSINETDIGNIANFWAYSGSGGGISFDEIRVSTLATDMTAIPEPSTYAALFGLAVLGVAACRRRQRQTV